MQSMKLRKLTTKKECPFDDPSLLKDTNRSTWWVPDDKYNFKMRQFVENLDIKIKQKEAEEQYRLAKAKEQEAHELQKKRFQEMKSN